MSTYSLPTLTLRTLIGLGVAIVMLLPVSAEAQIVRRFRGGGVQVRAPLVRVNVNPYGGTSVRAPFVAVDPGGVHVGLRQRLAPLPQQVAPPVGRPVGPQGQAYSGDQSERGYSGQGYVPFPSSDDLLAMDDPALFATLGDLFYALDRRLSRLSTGAGWQRYLLLPSDVLRDPVANLDQLEHGLARFDSVADNPEFSKIAGLPSFIATKAALRQVIARLAVSQAVPTTTGPQGPEFPAAAKDEILPTPATPKKPAGTRGERSILK